MELRVSGQPVAVNDFQNVFRQLPVRKLLLSAEEPDFIIEDITDSYAEMVGTTRSAMIGSPYFNVFPESNEAGTQATSDLIKAFRAVVRHKKPQVLQVFRHDLPDAGDSSEQIEQYWRPTLYPIVDDGGNVVHIVQIFSNATQEILATRELGEARHHLDEALEAGKVGSWTWDIKSDVMVGNAGLAKAFGVRVDDARNGLPLDTYVEAVHKDDRERIKRALRHAIDTNTTFDTEFRIVVDGKTRWVIGRGRVLDYRDSSRFTGVVVDVTERRDLQAQIDLARRQDRLSRAEAKMLQERNDELQAISRTKDEFVALASHQLRTPATAVKQYLGMVLQGYAGDITDLQTQMLGKAFESNERQIEIINQILNAARADTGKLAMTMVPVDIVALVRGVTDELRVSVEKREHKLVVKLPDAPVVLRADVAYLRMAIENLISNADKYTPEDGMITVSLRQSNHSVRLAVKDTGVGIPKTEFDKLFVKFSRVHNPLSVQAGGSGIGLYLAGEIVRLHGGRVEVISAVDKGTTFTIVFPVTG